MPTRLYLEQHGQKRMHSYIIKHGGYARVAAKMGLRNRLVARSWDDALETLKDYTAEHDTGFFPSQTELRSHERYDILSCMRKYGRAPLAESVGLPLRPKGRPSRRTSAPPES